MDEAVERFLDEVPVGTLATARAEGGIRQSVVYFVRDGDRLLVSTESKRGKARDVERDGWASLCVQGPAPPYPSVTIEGKASIVREGIGEPTARIVERITGVLNPAASDADLAAVDRVVLEISADRVYGRSHF
jgi:PPOX class probable F420-dependent enzyme